MIEVSGGFFGIMYVVAWLCVMKLEEYIRTQYPSSAMGKALTRIQRVKGAGILELIIISVVAFIITRIVFSIDPMQLIFTVDPLAPRTFSL